MALPSISQYVPEYLEEEQTQMKLDELLATQCPPLVQLTPSQTLLSAQNMTCRHVHRPLNRDFG